MLRLVQENKKHTVTRGLEPNRKCVYSAMVSVIMKAFTFPCMPYYVNYSREQFAMSWPVIINLIFCEVFISDTGNLTEPHQLTSLFLFMLENDFVILLLLGMFRHLPRPRDVVCGQGPLCFRTN